MKAKAYLKLGCIGESRLARRLVDVIFADSEMMVAGVCGGERMQALADLRGIPCYQSSPTLAGTCDAVIEVIGPRIRIVGAGKSSNGQPTNLPSGDSNAGVSVVPHPDVVALLRLINAFRHRCSIVRLSGTVVRGSTSGAGQYEGRIDSLSPVVNDDEYERDVTEFLRDIVPEVSIRQITAPVTDAHLLMLRLSLRRAAGESTVTDLLAEARRIVLSDSSCGFRSTRDVNELFRELARPRGDQWELFVWRDAVMSRGKDVFLTAHYVWDAISIPETVDEIARLSGSCARADQIHEVTDRKLCILNEVVHQNAN